MNPEICYKQIYYTVFRKRKEIYDGGSFLISENRHHMSGWINNDARNGYKS